MALMFMLAAGERIEITGGTVIECVGIRRGKAAIALTVPANAKVRYVMTEMSQSKRNGGREVTPRE